MNHEAHADDRGFVSRYIFSRDHKVIGIQFLISSLVWLFVGGALALAVRWQLAFPWSTMPIIGAELFPEQGGSITPKFYNMLFTMHGSVMVFLVIIPLLLGAFANYLIPLQIGARDMAFPTLNMLAYWVMWPAYVCFGLAFFAAGGGPESGWTSYPPLSAVAGRDGQVLWILGVTFSGASSMLGSINYMTTIVNLRAPGLSMFRLPLTVWALFITSFLQAFAVPVLTAAGLMLLADRTLGTAFFDAQAVSGAPIMWQHLFWFYSHPAVYIMVLPAMGIVSEIISNFSRKPIFGYRPMVYSLWAIALLGNIVWGHHMFTSGMNPAAAMAFQISTIFIALPSAVKVFNWIGTMWGGRIQAAPPMLYAIGFVSVFILGGLSGIVMAIVPIDLHIHDTYYIVAHFHFILAGSSLLGIFAGITYWYPKMFGRMLNETLSKLHFTLTYVFLIGTFLTMHQLGLAGMPRRLADPHFSERLAGLLPLNRFMTYCAIGMGVSQILLVVNMIWSRFFGKIAGPNPWRANTLEWSAPSPPPHGNWGDDLPVVLRGPHEFSVPGASEDFLPQSQRPRTELASVGEER
jgi:cytochrome c oxidase subunit I